MTVNVAFIGLGQHGLSAALALASQSHEIRMTGWDPNIDSRVAADRYKIFTPVCKRALDAVRDANLVILALPSDDVQPTLKVLGSALRKDIAIIALSPLHTQMRQWAEEALEKHTPFISIYTSPSAAALEEHQFGPDAARADDFEKSPVFIADAQKAPPAMLDLAVDIAVLLGGYPVFTSPEELDGLISANLLLHQLAAAVLMKTTFEQPSWREGKDIAGNALFHTTLPLMDLTERETIGLTAASNSENMTRLLDGLIRNFIQIRDDLKANDLESVTATFKDALEYREVWLIEKRRSQKSSQMASSVPVKSEALKRFLKLGK
jgi:prephenate dehydrogenase